MTACLQTGALEAANFFNTSKLISLSEQNMVDCSVSYGNGACYGGYVYKALQYVIDNDGIDKEKDYAYTATVRTSASLYTMLGWEVRESR